MNIYSCMEIVSEFGFSKTLSAIVALWETDQISTSQAERAIAVVQEEYNFLKTHNQAIFTLRTCVKRFSVSRETFNEVSPC